MPSLAMIETRFNESVLITEYFPLSRKTRCGVVIPVYPNGELPTLFKDMVERYTFVDRSCASSQPCDERLLSKEDYTADLQAFVAYMTDKHGGDVQFVIKDIDEMYETYVSVNSVKHVAGVVSICRYAMMNPVTDTTVVPPEGVLTLIGIETFTAAVKRNLPELVLDSYTIGNLYQLYIKNMGSDPANAIEIPSLITCPNINALIDLVGRAGDYLEEKDINAIIIDGSEDDNKLIKYYERIESSLRIRERIARSLLMYHPAIVKRTIAGAKKHLGVIVNESDQTLLERPVVWYKSKVQTMYTTATNLM